MGVAVEMSMYKRKISVGGGMVGKDEKGERKCSTAGDRRNQRSGCPTMAMGASVFKDDKLLTKLATSGVGGRERRRMYWDGKTRVSRLASTLLSMTQLGRDGDSP